MSEKEVLPQEEMPQEEMPQTGGSALVSGNSYVAFDHSSSAQFAGSYPEVVSSVHSGGKKKRATKKRKMSMKHKAKKSGKSLKMKKRVKAKGKRKTKKRH
jgi:hypothetical protein